MVLPVSATDQDLGSNAVMTYSLQGKERKLLQQISVTSTSEIRKLDDIRIAPHPQVKDIYDSLGFQISCRLWITDSRHIYSQVCMLNQHIRPKREKFPLGFSNIESKKRRVAEFVCEMCRWLVSFCYTINKC